MTHSVNVHFKREQQNLILTFTQLDSTKYDLLVKLELMRETCKIILTALIEEFVMIQWPCCAQRTRKNHVLKYLTQGNATLSHRPAFIYHVLSPKNYTLLPKDTST